MTAPRSEDAGIITLGEIIGALRRQWLILAAFALLGVVAGAAMMARSTGSYTTESQLVIEPITTDPFSASSNSVDAVNPFTEQSVLSGSAVAEEVISRLNLDTTPSNLLGRVEVENPLGSLTLIVSTTASTPEKSQALADTFAEVYLEQRQATADEAVAALVATINSELAATEDELAAANADRAGAVEGSFQAQQVDAQIATLRTRLGTLESRRTDLVSASTTPGRITREADLPTAAGGLPPIALGAGVFIFFLSGGAVLALLYDRRGGTVKDLSGIEAVSPGSDVRVVRGGSADLEEAVGALALAIVESGAEPVMAGIASVDSHAPSAVTQNLVTSLVSTGRRVLVIWTGARSALPEGRERWPVLEQLCDGTLPPLDDADARADIWVVPESGAGATALARDDAPIDVRSWAEQSGIDVVLVASPSPRLQPAVAGFSRYLDHMSLTSAQLPRRSDLAGAVSALSTYGVTGDVVLVNRASDSGVESAPKGSANSDPAVFRDDSSRGSKRAIRARSRKLSQDAPPKRADPDGAAQPETAGLEESDNADDSDDPTPGERRRAAKSTGRVAEKK